MHKKGAAEENLMENLLTLAVIIAILVITGLLIRNISYGTVYKQEYMSQSFSTILDSIYSAQGDYSVAYPSEKDTFSFYYEFKKNEVTVSDKDGISSIKRRYPFTQDKSYSFVDTELSPEFNDHGDLIASVRPLFLKQGNTIKVEDARSYEITEGLDCSNIQAEYSSAGKSIYVGYIDDYLKDEGKIRPLNDIIVVTTTGASEDKTINPIIAYYRPGSKESQKLACLVLKEIIENKKIKEIIGDKNLIPISGIKTFPTKTGHILIGNKVMVLLEIGNKEIDQDKNILNNDLLMSEVSKSINEGTDRCC